MQPKRAPTPESLAMLEAMFSPDPTAWDNWAKSMGFQPCDPDLPVCLANVPPEDWVEFSTVAIPPAIQRYLDSGDILTDHTIDMMEDAITRDYKVAAPWIIVSKRSGSEEDETLAVDYFYLLKVK